MDKFYNLKTYPQGLWGGDHIIYKNLGIRPFNYAEQNSNLIILIGRFWEKRCAGGGQVDLNFLSLKKGTRTFNFRYSEPPPDVLGPLVRFDFPGKKQ